MESKKDLSSNISRIERPYLTINNEYQELLESLKDEGVVTLEGLQGLEKGYLSKILHTIAHLQDGFIGIDSCLYNLEEDSHGISPDLQQQIAAAPDNYWILKVKGIIASVGDDSLDALRTFEWKGKTDD